MLLEVEYEFYINCFCLVEINSRKTLDDKVTSYMIHETADNAAQYKKGHPGKGEYSCRKCSIMTFLILFLLPFLARY